LAIKTDNWDDIWKNMLRIYNVLTMLNSPEYEKNVLLQLLQLRWMTKTGHPCMEVVKNHPYLMNGEDVELANSHLSRMTTSCSVRSNITDVERIFILLPNFRNAVRNATGSEPKDREGDLFMSADSYEVQRAADFLLMWSESVKDDTWLPYRHLTTREKYWGTREEEVEKRAWHAKTRRLRLGEAQLKGHMKRNVLKLKAGLAGEKIPPRTRQRRRRVANANSSSEHVPTHDEEDDVPVVVADPGPADEVEVDEEVEPEPIPDMVASNDPAVLPNVNPDDPLGLYDPNKETKEELDEKHVDPESPKRKNPRQAKSNIHRQNKRKGQSHREEPRAASADEDGVGDVHDAESRAASEEGQFAYDE